MKKTGWIVLLLVLLLEMPVAPNSEVKKSIAFHLLSNPQAWALGDQPTYLVLTEKNWPSYYSSQPKNADFRANIYIAAFLGLKPNPGHTVRILQLQQQGEVMNVKLELAEPDPNKVYIQVTVKPIAVAEVPKANISTPKPSRFIFTDQKGNVLSTVKTEIF